MSSDTLNTVGKYLIALIVLLGAFLLLYTAKATDTQPWTVIGLVVGWVVRDSAGSSATSNAVKTIAASIPATTIVTGPGAPPLAQTTVTTGNPTGV